LRTGRVGRTGIGEGEKIVTRHCGFPCVPRAIIGGRIAA
jgi:hypothetical protein